MRLLLLCNEQPNQAALAHKLARVCELAGVVVSANVPRAPARRRVRRFANRAASATVGRPFRDAWFSILARYAAEYGDFPEVPRTDVANVNDSPTLAAIESLQPELIAVSGTNIVGPALIEGASRHGAVMNLHTGISPYVKGGPNCTNWCLARCWFDLIGNTVMWLDAGIDSGNVIATERTPLDGTEDLAGLHWKVMEHAQDLYARAVGAHADGRELPNVPQDEIGTGPTFLNADWSGREMLRARWNFKRRYPRSANRPTTRAVTLVPLESG
jgi:folate-dependent phosphoribosylglycinamide formyltransferase PurN